jgi:hypothetical protein
LEGAGTFDDFSLFSVTDHQGNYFLMAADTPPAQEQCSILLSKQKQKALTLLKNRINAMLTLYRNRPDTDTRVGCPSAAIFWLEWCRGISRTSEVGALVYPSFIGHLMRHEWICCCIYGALKVFIILAQPKILPELKSIEGAAPFLLGVPVTLYLNQSRGTHKYREQPPLDGYCFSDSCRLPGASHSEIPFFRPPGASLPSHLWRDACLYHLLAGSLCCDRVMNMRSEIHKRPFSSSSSAATFSESLSDGRLRYIRYLPFLGDGSGERGEGLHEDEQSA